MSTSDDRRTEADREEQVHREHAAWLTRALAGKNPDAPLADDDEPDDEANADGQEQAGGAGEEHGSLIAALLRDGDESRGGSA